jgi:hypothetical protein
LPLNPVLDGCVVRGWVVALTASLGVACGFVDRRVANVYELREGFHGWALIQRGKASCPPLELRNGKHFLPISSDGRLCTSSELEDGWASDEYYSVGASRTSLESTGWGKGGHIWLNSYGFCGLSGEPVARFEVFFVGTEAEAKVAPKSPVPPECGAQ